MREPLVAAGIKPFARWQQDQRPKLYFVGDSALALLLPLAERPPGREDHFERAIDPCRVGGLEPLRGARVEGAELLIIFCNIALPDPGAHVRIDRRDWRDAVQ